MNCKWNGKSFLFRLGRFEEYYDFGIYADETIGKLDTLMRPLSKQLETLEKDVKYVHSQQNRHQNGISYVALVSLPSILNIFHTSSSVVDFGELYGWVGKMKVHLFHLLCKWFLFKCNYT